MEIANTMSKRALGLMFRKDGEMLFDFLFDVRFSVWTPFMRFSLDVFFLDKNLNVVDVKRNLVPWKFYKSKKKYRYFFESITGKYKEEAVISLVGGVVK